MNELNNLEKLVVLGNNGNVNKSYHCPKKQCKNLVNDAEVIYSLNNI